MDGWMEYAEKSESDVRVICPGFFSFQCVFFAFQKFFIHFFCQINYMTKRVAYVEIRESGKRKKVSMAMLLSADGREKMCAKLHEM